MRQGNQTALKRSAPRQSRNRSKKFLVQENSVWASSSEPKKFCIGEFKLELDAGTLGQILGITQAGHENLVGTFVGTIVQNNAARMGGGA